MASFDRAHRVREQAERRLHGVARQWRPSAEAWEAEEWEEVPTRISVGPWSRPALRGLILLTAIGAVVIGYLMWQSAPREVVEVASAVPQGSGAATPEVLATGAPLTGAVEPLPAEAMSSTAPSPVLEVVVHVAGQVHQPGLVRLPAGSRVADAIEQAGGFTRARAATSINLARILVDGEQILVSDRPGAATVPAASGPAHEGAAEAGDVGAVIDLNTATETVLDGLPGVGPVLAGRIVAWRQEHGAFRSVDELGEVSGIGDATLARLRPLVRV